MDILEFIGFSETKPHPFEEFLTKVANRSLLRLARIRQHGIHRGQTLYAHLVNVALTVDLAAQIVGCTDEERRLLICAAILHDLNKLDSAGSSISKISTTEEVRRWMKEFDLDTLVPLTEENIEVIRRLIASHSGHLHQAGDNLLPFAGSVSRKRLEMTLIPLIQLADQADVARDFSEKWDAKRSQVLMALNSASDVQYRWEWHRLNEYRGPFSNLLHNAVSDELQAQLGAKPFLQYGDGTYYLVPASSPKQLNSDYLEKISKRLALKIAQIKGRDVREFVQSTNQGIKITPGLFATGVSLSEAFEVAVKILQNRKLNSNEIKRIEDKIRKKNEEIFEKLKDSSGNLFSRDPEIWRIAEFLRTVFIFLNSYCKSAFSGKNKKYQSPWHAIYSYLKITPRLEWDSLDARYERAYLIARTVANLEFNTIQDRLTELSSSLEEFLSLRGSNSVQNPVFSDYVFQVLSISCASVERQSFFIHLQTYSNPMIAVCSLCGMALPAKKMMKGEVPNGLIVSQFSNRNLAGTGDPKRNSCPICREQLFVEKIGFAPALSKGFYLHIFPETFASPLFVEALKKTFRKLLETDIRAMLFDTRTIAREFETNAVLKLDFKPKAFGLAIPLYSELVGNILTLPLYPLGDNDSERYLFALQYAVFMFERFGQRVVLTQSLVPPVNVTELLETEANDGIKLYCDDMPGTFQGLVPHNALSGKQAEDVFSQLHDLKIVADKIGTGADLIDLVRSLNDGELGVFFAAHRAIERNAANEGIANAIGGTVADKLKLIAHRIFQTLKGAPAMNDVSLTEILEQMAELAWKKSIKGSTLAHTSLIKPLDIVFQLLRRESGREASFLKLVAIEEVLRHIQRTSDFCVGSERAAAIEAWADLCFDGLLTKGFQGDVRRLIRDEKLVKAAYTTLMRRQLTKASEAKKQNSATPNT